MKGVERGVELGLKKLNFVASVSETHNLSNVRRKPEESVEDFGASLDADALPEDKKFVIDGGMSTVFGCTLEGNVDPAAAVNSLSSSSKPVRITSQCAIQLGSPIRQVRDMFKLLQSELGPDITMTAHFHDTRGLALANMEAALDVGIRSFDACSQAWGCLGTGSIRQHGYGRRSFHGRSDGNAHRHRSRQAMQYPRDYCHNLPGEPLNGAIAKAGVPKGHSPANSFAPQRSRL